MTVAATPEARRLPTYEECIEKAARVYADWLAERQMRQLSSTESGAAA